MQLGLGTGRAAEAFIRRLGRAVADGLDVVGIPTSDRSERLAGEHGIRLGSFAEVSRLDLAFDGADEVAPDLSLVKGKGGAMLRERVVAALAGRFIVLVTPDKLVTSLGQKCPLPVEVVPFAVAPVRRRLESFGVVVERTGSAGGAYRTDNGNAVLDVAPAGGCWTSPREADAAIRALPGVVDTGFFFSLAAMVLVGEGGAARVISRT